MQSLRDALPIRSASSSTCPRSFGVNLTPTISVRGVFATPRSVLDSFWNVNVLLNGPGRARGWETANLSGGSQPTLKYRGWAHPLQDQLLAQQGGEGARGEGGSALRLRGEDSKNEC